MSSTWNDLTDLERRFLIRLARPHIQQGTRPESYPEIAARVGSTGEYLKKLSSLLLTKLQVADRTRYGLTEYALKTFRRPISAALIDGTTRPRVSRPQFVGRSRELRDLAAACAQRRFVTVLGPVGIGKTRLVEELLEQDDPRRAFRVDIADAVDDRAVAVGFALALGASRQPQPEDVSALCDTLRGSSGLLFLDGCERFTATTAAFANALLANLDEVQIIATITEPLGSPIVEIFQLGPLNPPASRASLADLGASECVQLFCQTVVSVGSSVDNDPNSLRTIGRICRKLDGIPLSIRIAGSYVGSLSLADIEANLDDLRDVSDASDLRTGDAVRWGYDRLDNVEAAVLRRAGIFQSSFTLDSVRAVGVEGPPELTSEAITTAVASLVRRSMLVSAANGPSRYRLLAPVRRVARAELARSVNELANTEAAVIDWAITATEKANRAPLSDEGFAAIDAEYENVIAAFRTALKNRQLREASAIVSSLCDYWLTRGLVAEGRRLIGDVLEAKPSGEDDVAELWASAGDLAVQAHELIDANTSFEASLNSARAAHDQANVGRALVGRGNVAYMRGFHEDALSDWHAAAAAFEEAEMPAGVGAALSNACNVALSRGDHDAAVSYAERALTAFADKPDALREANCLFVLGNVALSDGAFQSAIGRFDECLRTYEELGSLSGQANCLANLGAAHFHAGEVDEAESLWQETLKLRQKSGEAWGEAAARANLAQISNARGHLDKSASWLQQALETLAESESGPGLPETLEVVAELLTKTERYESAAQLLGSADAIRRSMQYVALGIDKQRTEAHLEDIRTAIQARRCRAAFNAGKSLGADEVLPRALEFLASTKAG
jgi:predicted ATPase